MPSLQADHPRSRGVYPWLGPSPSGRAGSSPLARGLPGLVLSLSAVDGIIPARAGFTLPSLVQPVETRDHPRSRGVYSPHGLMAERCSGSSPLARGLRNSVKLRVRECRIIPARAGFTKSRQVSSYEPRDHPRSRGVYGGKCARSV